MSKDSKSQPHSILAGIISIPAAITAAVGDKIKDTSPELGYGLMVLGGVISGVAGYKCNRLASAADADDNLSPASADEIGLNHHLARLAGQALKTIIEETANSKPDGSVEQNSLLAAAERATRAWVIVLEAPSGEHFRKLNSSTLTKAVAMHAVAAGNVEVLTIEQWLPFARYVLGESGAAVMPSSLAKELAGKCEKEFARHFFEHAKFSAEKDPPAFAALLIQFLADIRFTLRGHGEEFMALRGELETVLEKFDDLAQRTIAAPGFNWDRLTAFLADATVAHAEARRFYENQNRNWDELLPLARDTWKLVRDLHTSHHDQIIHSIAGLNLLLKDQVLAILGELRRGDREPLSGAAVIVEFIRTQRELDLESRRQFQAFLERRDSIRGQGGHHYFQPEKWTPGHRTRKLWREAGQVFVPRAPLAAPDDVPPPGSNYYLYGESGQGKSILAANIADRLLAKGYRALTFNLRQPGDILRHLALLTDKEWLGLDQPEKSSGPWDDTAKVVAACTWLLEETRDGDDRHPPFCLVWDNADDLVTLDHLFQLQLLHHRGVQIITTRIPPTVFSFPDQHPCHDWPPRLLKLQRVGPYTKSEAGECLRQSVSLSLANGFGSPAANDHQRILAGARSEGNEDRFDPLKLSDLLARLQKQGWRLETVPGIKTGSVVRAASIPAPSHIDVLKQTIADLRPLARAIWNILISLAPAPIPEDFWSAIGNAFSDLEDLDVEDRAALTQDLRGRLPIVQARAALAEAGLLTGGDDGDVVHTRHYALGRELIPGEARSAIYRQVVRLLWCSAPMGDPGADIKLWSWYRIAEPHLLAALAPERTGEIVSLKETYLLADIFGRYLIVQSRLVEAETIEMLSLESSVAVDGRSSLSYVASLHSLALVHLGQGRYTEAETGFQKALEIAIQNHGENGQYAAVARHELAGTHLEQGRYAEAKVGFQKVMEIEMLHHGENHPNVSAVCHELARAHLEQRCYLEAEAGFKKSIKIFTQTKGEKSWETAASQAHLARVFWMTGREREAGRLFKEALATIESVFGNEHPRVAQVLSHWAECEMGAIPGDTEASPLSADTMARLQRALTLVEQKLGRDHPRTAQTRLLQAECLRREGDLPAALNVATAATTVLRRSFSSEHRSVRQAEALLLLFGGR